MTDIGGERSKLRAQGLHIISRETWDAVQDYTSDRTVSFPAEGFFLHISVTIDHGDLTGNEHADMRTIERIGQERFGIGFPYNAAVFDTGRLYEGQPLTRRGAHTVNDENVPGFRETGSHGSLNYWYRALCLPQMVTDDVTDAQIDQAARWAAAQIRAGLAKPGATWYGHRDVSPKSCPGDTGYARLPELRQLTRHYEVNGLRGDWFDMASEADLLRIVRGEVQAAAASIPAQVWNVDVLHLPTEADRAAAVMRRLNNANATAEQIAAAVAAVLPETLPDGTPTSDAVKEAVKQALREGVAA
jgi:hypothetical protein